MIDISPHARKRMQEMLVDDTEVLDTVEHPEVDKPSMQEPDRRLAKKGRLCVVYASGKDRRTVCTVLWDNKTNGVRADGPASHVPNQISNRAFHEKLLLWGCTGGRKRGDLLYMRTPGGDQLSIRPPGYRAGNSAKAIIGAYRSLGVSAEEFWARTEKIRPPRERVHATPAALAAIPTKETPVTAPEPQPTAQPTTTPPRLTSTAGRVYAYYRGHPGETPSSDQVAEALHLTVHAAINAAGALHRNGHLERVGPGQYRYRRWGETEAAKAQAQRDLAAVLDPANLPPPPAKATRKRRLGGAAQAVLDFYQAQPGVIIKSPTIAKATGHNVKTVQNAQQRLHQSGILQRGDKRGHYFYSEKPAPDGPTPPELIDDPIQRLAAIQRRIDSERDQPADEPAQPTETPVADEVAPVTRPVTTVAAVDSWVPASLAVPPAPDPVDLDDEIDTVFELLVPGRIKARHFILAQRWYAATQELLEATRNEQ